VIALKSREEFVATASHELQAEGARVLFDRAAGTPAPDWLAAWDEVLVNETPGAAALYAFVSGDGIDARILQQFVDGLTSGLADFGVFRGPPVSLNVVVTFTASPDPAARRSATHLVPRAFFPGLRPHSYAVDLSANAISGGRSSSVREILERALRSSTVPGLDPVELEQRRIVHTSRTSQFYDLMRGRQPVVTYGLVLVNVVIFLLMVGSSGNRSFSTVMHGGPVSDGTVRAWGAQSPTLIEHGQWWRLVSEMFLHASLTHIVFNMASLLAVGTLAERLYGSRKFLAIYLGAGLIGSFVSFAFAVVQGNLNVLGVGASGAIFGVAGALLTVRFQQSDVIPAALRRRVSSSMAPLVLVSLFLAAVTPYVDNSAHLGGLLGGMALSFAFPLVKTAPAASRP
jgi:membrane associated rhomboid family serine protease